MRERMTAVRASVADIIRGTYNEEDGHHVVSPQGVELRRVVLVGFIVRQYVGQGSFASITIDDGTETIRAKAWGETQSLEQVETNTLAMIVGKVREYEGEVYIVPEIVRTLDDANYMTLHQLERYRAILTRSGISTPSESESMGDVQETLKPVKSKSSTPAKKPKSPRTLATKILQFIRENVSPDGVYLQDIVSCFEKQGSSKSAITLKVIDLMDKQKIREVKIGYYLPIDT
ncbi:MAG: hypothetical protein KAT22_02505 [Candidatus Thorarchaeota archaeon]|nr:hypothetical protein [Candidatus Thorarchaeota archaeon]